MKNPIFLNFLEFSPHGHLLLKEKASGYRILLAISIEFLHRKRILSCFFRVSNWSFEFTQHYIQVPLHRTLSISNRKNPKSTFETSRPLPRNNHQRNSTWFMLLEHPPAVEYFGQGDIINCRQSFSIFFSLYFRENRDFLKKNGKNRRIIILT